MKMVDVKLKGKTYIFNLIPFHDTKEVSLHSHGDASKSLHPTTLQISAFQCAFNQIHSFLGQK